MQVITGKSAPPCQNVQLLIDLSDSETFTIMIIEIVIFTSINVITIVDLLNITIHDTKIKHEFVNQVLFTVLGYVLYHFKKFL